MDFCLFVIILVALGVIKHFISMAYGCRHHYKKESLNKRFAVGKPGKGELPYEVNYVLQCEKCGELKKFDVL